MATRALLTPAGRDEPWFLITDLPGGAVALTELYGRRMAVEELFRDDKSLRNGWALRLTQLTKADRFDRLLLVLALAYWLLVGLALVARSRHRPGAWCGSDRVQECSAFTIGRVLIDWMRARPTEAFEAVRRASAAVASKWGRLIVDTLLTFTSPGVTLTYLFWKDSRSKLYPDSRGAPPAGPCRPLRRPHEWALRTGRGSGLCGTVPDGFRSAVVMPIRLA